VATWKWYNL